MAKTDIEIANEVIPLPINEIAKRLNIDEDDLELYGKYKAKLNPSINKKIENNKEGKLILVTAITPTKAGEGKTTTTVGLVDGLAKINKKVMGALREPSLGPVFGVKGGATGGGYSQVIPMEDINLHFTGDLHAITAANNLISAALDNSLFQGNPLNINPEKILWKRAMDMNDRSLRKIIVGIGDKNGIERNDGFNISVASEVMATMCLSKDIFDFEDKISKCVVAMDVNDQPITVKDLKVQGSVAALMKDALKPNLVQSLEHNPFLIHGGPFANIAHGCNSIIATKTALKLADYVVTEAGFGADLGCEKFVDIKCRMAGLKPSAIVLVLTTRAIKLHGGVLYEDLKLENIDACVKGFDNVLKHVETLKEIGVPFVLSLNKFSSDTDKEVETIFKLAEDNGLEIAFADGWANGGDGMVNLANKVVELTERENNFKYIYDLEDSLETKLNKIVHKVYGGKDVIFNEKASDQLKEFKKHGWDMLPICVAKTQNSLSDNAKLLGRPKDFDITVKELRISKGAGFVVCLLGNIMTMPGLPKVPAAENIDIDEDGNIVGLF